MLTRGEASLSLLVMPSRVGACKWPPTSQGSIAIMSIGCDDVWESHVLISNDSLFFTGSNLKQKGAIERTVNFEPSLELSLETCASSPATLGSALACGQGGRGGGNTASTVSKANKLYMPWNIKERNEVG